MIDGPRAEKMGTTRLLFGNGKCAAAGSNARGQVRTVIVIVIVIGGLESMGLTATLEFVWVP
jgi:hypothetical protein